MTVLLIIRGPPGAGKSTIAIKVAEKLKGKTLVFNKDALFRGVSVLRMPFDSEAFLEPAVVSYLRRGVSLILEGAFGGPHAQRRMDRLERMAKTAGARFFVVNLHVPLKTSCYRCRHRTNHIIPGRMDDKEVKKWHSWSYKAAVEGVDIHTDKMSIAETVRTIVALVRTSH